MMIFFLNDSIYGCLCERKRTFLCLVLSLILTHVHAQTLTLKDCFEIAHSGNIGIRQANTSLKARELNSKAERENYLPKIDFLGSYSYLSNPLEINLQTVKAGIVEGSAQQGVQSANETYKEITGNDLSQQAQQNIYNTNYRILDKAYPNYNPALSKQQYFIANLGFRQPLFLGGKLSAARKIAKGEYESGKANADFIQKETDFAVALQYIRILYLNSLKKHQQVVIDSLSHVDRMAESFVKNNMIPPYQRNWVKVALVQAKNRSNSIELDKENALIEMKRLLGVSPDTTLSFADTLHYKVFITSSSESDDFWKENPTYKLVSSKNYIAKSTIQASRSTLLPNLFGIGNYNLYQKDLPLTMPPWMLGVEMQWTIFSGTQNFKRISASKQLLEESKLATENTKQMLESQNKVLSNKLVSLDSQIKSLDSARTESYETTRMVSERMKNNLSSVKDVNEVLLMQEEIEKAYFTAVASYYLVLAEYYNIQGTPQKITDHIQ